ncbi:hypothetical protein D3C78_901160 [compost metagenome]
MQQNQLGQLAGVVQGAALQQLWRANWHHLFTEQFDAGRARPGALAEEEHHIGLALQQGEGLHLIADIQVDIRMTLAEAFEVRNQPAHAKTRLGGYLQYFSLLAVREDVAAGHIDLGKDLVDLGQV